MVRYKKSMRTVAGRFGTFVLFASAGLLVPLGASAQDLSSPSYQMLAPVVTSGGGYANSNSFSLLGVISEFVHDTASSLSFSSIPGFAAFPFVSTPVVSATAGNVAVSLTWTAAVGVLGYAVSGYSIGQSTAPGGPYSFTSVGNVLSSTASSLSNGTPYYFVVRVHDPHSIVIATSSEVSGTPTAPVSPPPSGGGGGHP